MQNLEKLNVHVGKAVRILISELGLDVETVMRRAGLASGLLDRDGSRISLEEYFRIWDTVTSETHDPLLALKLGDAAGIDYLDPAFFVAMCSQDMNMAMTRLADYKRRVSPFTFDVQIDERATKIAFCEPASSAVHPTLALAELVFLVNFARRATRRHICPMSVFVPFDVPDRTAYEDHLGCQIRQADIRAVTFDVADAQQPFVTHNDEIWDLFEPRLQRQVAGDDPHPTVRTRVSHCLNAFLPSGRASVDEVARELAMSKRTLQRRLAEEGTNWLEVLNEARETLAKHYLRTTDHGTSEVSFLLGFEDPNSLFRAFKRWEDTSPELWRARHKEQNSGLH